MTQSESDVQFLARMILATREGDQLSSVDARRLGEVAKYGSDLPGQQLPGRTPSTMPEERRQGDKPIGGEPRREDLVNG